MSKCHLAAAEKIRDGKYKLTCARDGGNDFDFEIEAESLDEAIDVGAEVLYDAYHLLLYRDGELVTLKRISSDE